MGLGRRDGPTQEHFLAVFVWCRLLTEVLFWALFVQDFISFFGCWVHWEVVSTPHREKRPACSYIYVTFWCFQFLTQQNTVVFFLQWHLKAFVFFSQGSFGLPGSPGDDGLKVSSYKQNRSVYVLWTFLHISFRMLTSCLDWFSTD